MIANSATISYGVTLDPAVFSNIATISGNITTLQVATAYNFPASTGANTKVGIISLGGGWQMSDLTKSLSNLGISTTPTVTTVLVDGASGTFDTSTASSENTLDLYAIASIVPSANIVIYISPPSLTSFANCVNRAVNENCDVISISWGADEINGYGDFLATPLANAAAKSITVFNSTGDYGSESDNNISYVSAGYPATNPNVVAVGGTIISLNPDGTRSTEVASPLSGGGISTLFPVPSWQNGKTYTTSPGGVTVTLNSGALGYVGGYPVGRGVPDISAPMFSYALWFNNAILAGTGGTSISTPIMAGLMTRYISLNGGRRPPVNSIHPILYSNLNAYTDVTSGNNNYPLGYGYAATANWDPVTGLGPPKGNIVYQMVSSGGTTVKTAANTWSYLANVKVKTGATTWSNVRAIWTKTVNGWAQSF